MAKSTSLRFTGGGSLTFEDALGRRQTVVRGVRFETDEATANALLASDGGVALASDDGPVVGALPDAAANVVGAPDRIDKPSELKVDELRSALEAAGLDTGGNKPALVDRVEAYQAGFTAGARTQLAGTAWALMSPSPGAPLDISPSAPEPNSSEAEPGAPPPPDGGLTAENEAHNTGTPTEGSQVGDDAGAATGAISLDDLGEGGKTK